MILSVKTLNILKNFSTINPSALFKKGSVLKTMSPTCSVMAVATVPETFETEFAVYSLARFINTISMFTEPELIFGEHSVLIEEGNRSVVYHFTEPSLITVPLRDKNPSLGNIEVEFRLTHKNIQDVQKALGVLQLHQIAVKGDGEEVLFQANSNMDNNNFSIVVGKTTKTFEAVFKAENLKLIAGDYNVQISSKGAHFYNEEIEYWIAIVSYSAS